VITAGTVRGQKSPAVEQQKLEDPTSVLKQDFRTFICETWHLEPTVRLDAQYVKTCITGIFNQGWKLRGMVITVASSSEFKKSGPILSFTY